ncbi:MAG: single-stranded-DNA-specific exonuclease RecJ, partial [Chloroflexaceae bacterium]|nr:single-stranded-DNA-specific exonuclease RecJ [Chloroflexaceae bacterium]
RTPRIDAAAIGFGLGPRINAAGRLDDAIRAYHLLLADDLATAHDLARDLNRANRQRQEITRSVFEAATAQYEEQLTALEEAGQEPPRLIVLARDDYPAGIVGLVASRLVERWARPVVLIAQGETESRGSARSLSGYNIFHALNTCKDLFIRFGGHSLAAGFSIANENIPLLTTRLQALAADTLTDAMLQPVLLIDAEVPLQALVWELLNELALLEPFGQANPQPVLMTRRVRVQSTKTLGSDNKHLKITLTAPDAPAVARPLEGIAFGLGHLAEPLLRHPLIDIAYTLEAHTWNGTANLQLNIKDLRRAQP